MSNRRAAGFTLVEMVITIVIIGVGLAGLLLAFDTSVKSSADPLMRKQVLVVAEEMMEEVLLKPFAVNGTAPVNALASCGAAAATRTAFDDISDYHGYATTGICDIEGTAVDGLGSYSVTVAVDAAASLGDAASGGALASGKVKKVTVTVTGGGENITLIGWRTWYACELPAACPP